MKKTSSQVGAFRRSLMVVIALTTAFCAFAQETIVSVCPTVGFPLVPKDIYVIEAGGSVNLRIDPILANLEGNTRLGFSTLMIDGNLGNVSIVRAEAGCMLPILKTQTFTFGPLLLAGAYGAFKNGSTPLFNPIVEGAVRAEAKLGNLRFGLEPGVEMLIAKENGSIGSFLTAFTLPVSVAFTPGATGHRALLKIGEPKLDPVFPVIYKSYATLPLGTVTIENKERSTVTNVAVTFFVPAYMDGPQTVATIPSLKPGEKRDIPITGLFKNTVLGITETDTAQTQIKAQYAIGKNTFTVDRDGIIDLQGRNAIVWTDDRIAAAFVTAKDPTILKLARNAVAGIPKNDLSVPSEAFKKAAMLFQSLETYGLAYVVDPKGSYATMKDRSESVDYLQFPVETLTYKTGDCDDLATLYLAMLESVGVETAFITVPGHIYSAFALEGTAQSAKMLFSNVQDLIFMNDKIWIPVETTSLGKGFTEAWTTGAREWREAERQGAAALVQVHEAWKTYEPSFISSAEKQDVTAKFPNPQTVAKSYSSMMQSVAAKQLDALVTALSGGKPMSKVAPAEKNRIGALYARYGIMDKAESAFKDAAAEKLPAALINLGNIHFIKRDFAGAIEYYRQALAAQATNGDAALGLSRSLFESSRYDEASSAFKQAQSLSPEKAAGYAYIAGGAEQATARAADAESRASVDWTY